MVVVLLETALWVQFDFWDCHYVSCVCHKALLVVLADWKVELRWALAKDVVFRQGSQTSRVLDHNLISLLILGRTLSSDLLI